MLGSFLTDVRYSQMIEYHRGHHADMTIGLNLEQLNVPYGLVSLDGPRIVSIEEKPEITLFMNAGIYVIEPHVLELIPQDQRYDMDELIAKLINSNKTVVGFPLHESWIDIGTPDSYQNAQIGTARPDLNE